MINYIEKLFLSTKLVISKYIGGYFNLFRFILPTKFNFKSMSKTVSVNISF